MPDLQFMNLKALTQYAQQIFPPGSAPPGGPTPVMPSGLDVQMPGLTNRPTYRYLQTQDNPRAGPRPKLSAGSGQTGLPASPGMSAALGSYVSYPDYQPNLFDYQPPTNPNRYMRVSNSGTFTPQDGGQLFGTYRAHDFTIANYTQSQWRSSAMWEQLGFPPNFRQQIMAQQVKKYNIYTSLALARPLAANDYFLGYRIPTQTAADIGGSSATSGLGNG